MTENKDFLVVGMGASAGGLETFQRFFSDMPPDSGLSFVLVQHLHPHHESLMPELLSKSTDMPVLSASEGMEMKPNHVYVIPSNSTLTVNDGKLHIQEPSESRGHRMPIDLFFKSLSEDCGERAICVVLSGTGSDGTLGLKAVKEHGGLAIAQNPETAKYDSMPRNAIHTGLVDMILDVQDMPSSIMNYLDKSLVLKKEMDSDDEVELHLETIFAQLEEQTQHEFKGYKRNTILRRIRRRMQILQLDSLKVYAERVSEDNDEANRLFKDLLIGVTHFFRDTSSFEYLQERVIPLLLRRKLEGRDSNGLRVWVAGCATGEEAYSLALMIREEAAKLKMSLPVQIFATDIDDNALSIARRASYPEGIEDQVPEKYLSRYFSKRGNYYQVHKSIREMCIFSPHNLISDPPYSRIDLISCRNLLIYFDNQLQRKILPIFHYSLSLGGYLFLGPSENVSARPELFRTMSKEHKIFQSRENVPPTMIDFPVGRRTPRNPTVIDQSVSEQKRESEKVLAKAFERKVLENYVPFSAVINENANILYWAGPQARYLEHPRGIPRNNLLEIVNKSLRLTLRSGLHKVITTGKDVEQNDVVILTSEGMQRLQVNISPFREMGEESGLIFVVIRELGQPKSQSNSDLLDSQARGDEVNQQLEEELKDTKAYLQSTIEELETSNEELKSSNEELLSMNEELQSSNEELQTSKEELQSVNEELETVNAELKNKVQELDIANSDLHNLYESTQIATLFLDNDLRIKAFTPATVDLFRIIDSDVNRPIEDIVSRFNTVDIIREARLVLERLEKRSQNISHKETGNHYIMQMRPYKTVNNTIDGVTISFIDVTDLKRTQEELEIRERMLRLVTDSMPLLVSYIDCDQKYVYCNAAYGQWFDLKKEDIVGREVAEVLGGKNYPEVRPRIEKALRGEVVDFITTIRISGGQDKIAKVHYEPHLTKKGEVCGFISCIQDESERILREQKLGRLAAIVNSSHEVIIGKNKDGVITNWNKGAEELYGYSATEAVGQNIRMIVPEEKHKELEEAYDRLRRGKVVAPFETTRRAKDGSIKHILLSLALIRNEQGESLGISAVGHDISDRIATEKELETLNENLEKRVMERTGQLHKLTARLLGLEQRERRRFSKYLHDEIQQAIAAAKMMVEQAHNTTDPDKVAPALSESLRLLAETIANTRSITVDMSPPLFFDTGVSVCLDWLSRWAKTKLKLQVETCVEGEERPVAEEAGYLLYRSLRELLFNIHKHAGTDKAKLTLKFEDDGGLEVVVDDQGKGFDQHTVMNSSTDNFGMLSLIEQVNAMMGSVFIDTKVGKGTRISITLPAAIAAAGKKETVPRGKKRETLAAKNRERMGNSKAEKVILIVDDQEDLRYTLRLMLEDISSDYVFIEANDAVEAIEAVREFKPQLVLMDVSMPGMNGVEATRKILEEHGDMAIIGLSMHEREDMEKAMLEAGAVDYITKDSPSEVVLATIEKSFTER